MDIKSCLLLCEPINFNNVCTIYPIDILSYIKQDEIINRLYLPYVITTDIVAEEFKKLSIFEIVIYNEEYRELLVDSIKLFCKTDEVKIISDSNGQNSTDFKIQIGDYSEFLTKYNFDEFADLILLIGCKQKYKQDVIPIFETPEGYDRWKKYEEQRQKYQVKEDTSIANIINVVQTGTSCYIDENIIKKWSMWKLMNTYTSIISRDSYEKKYSKYLVSGKPDEIKEHWSELLKVK